MPQLNRPRKRPVPPSDELFDDDLPDDLFAIGDEDNTTASQPAPASDISSELPALPKEAIRAFAKKPPSSIDELRHYYKTASGFDGDDLLKSANLFIPKQLRTPPSPQEIERLRRERDEKMRKSAQEYNDEMRKLSDKYGDEGLSNGV